MPHLGFSGPEKKMMGTPNPTRPRLSFIKIKKKKKPFRGEKFLLKGKFFSKIDFHAYLRLEYSI